MRNKDTIKSHMALIAGPWSALKPKGITTVRQPLVRTSNVSDVKVTRTQQEKIAQYVRAYGGVARTRGCEEPFILKLRAIFKSWKPAEGTKIRVTDPITGIKHLVYKSGDIYNMDSGEYLGSINHGRGTK